MTLSRNYIEGVLGIPYIISESKSANQQLHQKIIYEHLLLETFLDSIKTYAGKAIDKTVSTVTNYADLAVVLSRVFSSFEFVDSFSKALLRHTYENYVKPVLELLDKVKLTSATASVKAFYNLIQMLNNRWSNILKESK